MAKEENIQNWEKIAKLLADKGVNEEKDKLESEFQQSESISSLDEAKSIFKSYPDFEEPFEVNVAADFETVMNKIDAGNSKRKTIVFGQQKWTYGIAASLTIILAIGFVYKFFLSSDRIITVTTADKEKTEILLADGTKVWLNEESLLSYPKEFSDNNRIVKIDGEAYFEVARDINKPFIIEGNNSKTTVLGTSFNLRDQKSDFLSEVNVFTGKVSFANIKNPSQNVVLEKGQTGSLDIDANTVDKKEEADLNLISWKTGVIQFNDTGLADVINFISAHYDIKINLENKIMEDCRFSGSFKKLTIEEVLKRICQLYGTSYSTIIPNKEFLIKAVNC